METRANFALIGLFVLAVFAGGFGFVYWLLRGGDNGEKREVVIVFSNSVSGLATGSAVTFNGIRIGEVARLSFAPDDPSRVLAYITVDPTTPLKRNTRAQLGFSGLTGVASVQLEGGSRDEPNLLTDGQTPIMYADPSAVQNLLEGARQVVARADSTLLTVDALVRENGPAIARTVRNIESFTNAIAANPDVIERFMGDVGRAADILSKVVNRIDPLVDQVDRIVKAVDPAKVTVNVDNITRLTGELVTTTSEAQALLRDARGVLVAIDQSKIKASVDAIAALTQQIQGRSGEIDQMFTGGAAAIGSLQAFAADLSKRTAEIDRILAAGQGAAEDVRSLTKGLASRGGDIDQIITATRDLSVRLAEASKRIDGILASVDGLVGSPEGQGLFASGRNFLDEATLTAKAVRDMAASFEARGTEIAATINRLSTTGLREVRDLAAEGRRSLQSLERAASEIERNPQRFLYGSSPVREYTPQRR